MIKKNLQAIGAGHRNVDDLEDPVTIQPVKFMGIRKKYNARKHFKLYDRCSGLLYIKANAKKKLKLYTYYATIIILKQ